MPVSTLAKNKQTPCSIFKSPAPQNRNAPPQKKTWLPLMQATSPVAKVGKKTQIYIVTYIL